MKLLFLCTGNSCRSQMAEGWARHLRPQFEVRSAGIEAHGVNPRAIAVMGEAGVDISHQESTRLDPDMIAWAEVIITVCGHADTKCPTVPADKIKIHWPLDDPAKATGSEAEIMSIFRSTRDEIKDRVAMLLATLDDARS